MKNSFCIGIDYGTDSVRALLVDAENGKELATSVFEYPRWKQGLYCNPEANQFRQHPLDYLEGLEYTIKSLLRDVPGSENRVKAISIDTTGSTPIAVNRQGIPLSLLPEFKNDPDAMFILWKDHTAIAEAEQINELCRKWEVDYTKYSGGIYSSEWFWAKIMHVIKKNKQVADAAYSWVEHCDWMPAILTGELNPLKLMRCRSSAGHKALWHPEWDGLPSADFLNRLYPELGKLRDRLYSDTYTSNLPAGRVSAEWAEKLGLNRSVLIGVGAMDSHFGFVGGQIEPYQFYKVMGTSTVDMILASENDAGNNPIPGICGQVNGSVIPGLISMEAGQSAFGDVYAWFKDVLLWPLKNSPVAGLEGFPIHKIESGIIASLSKAAAMVPPGSSGVLAVDWLNGRRSPNANPYLKGALAGLTLGTDAPKIFRALVEATAFGSKKIMDHFEEAGIPRLDGLTVMGGVARKSPFVMQIMADVLNTPIKVVRSENACALGASMFAAVVAGIYPDVREAQKQMGAGFDLFYQPDPANVPIYQKLYNQYNQFCLCNEGSCATYATFIQHVQIEKEIITKNRYESSCITK